MSYIKKSLSDRLNKSHKALFRDLIQYGSKEFQILENKAAAITSLTNKVKSDIETLKISANCFGLFSAAAPQFGISSRMFVIAKNLQKGLWFDKNLKSNIDYNVYINPKIIAVSRLQEFDWEYCGSFPNLKASIRRYAKIRVNYMDEKLEEVQQDLKDFQARLFQHELDHLKGSHLMVLDEAHGPVEQLDDGENVFVNFEKAMEYYRDQIELAKAQNPSQFDVREVDPKNPKKKLNTIKKSMHKIIKIPGQQNIYKDLVEAAKKDWELKMKKEQENKDNENENEPETDKNKLF